MVVCSWSSSERASRSSREKGAERLAGWLTDDVGILPVDLGEDEDLIGIDTQFL